MQANALPVVEVGHALYDLAVEKAGGYDKLPSKWSEGLDLDRELARLFAGRHFDQSSLADLDPYLSDHIYGTILRTQPERLVIALSQGTMHCATWETFVAEGDLWVSTTPTVGPDEAHDNCYGEPSFLELGGNTYIAHVESPGTVALLPIVAGAACTLSLHYRGAPTMNIWPVGAVDPVLKAMADDLVILGRGNSEPAERFRPDPWQESLHRLLESEPESTGSLPDFDFTNPERKKTGSAEIYRPDIRMQERNPEQQATYEMLTLIPGDKDAWNEIEGIGVQFFGYQGRHFAWVIGTPHIGWRQLGLPGFGVYEIVGEKLVPRLGGHMQNDVQYVGATPGPAVEPTPE
jgi:hypothetical protein